MTTLSHDFKLLYTALVTMGPPWIKFHHPLWLSITEEERQLLRKEAKGMGCAIKNDEPGFVDEADDER